MFQTIKNDREISNTIGKPALVSHETPQLLRASSKQNVNRELVMLSSAAAT